ncbi:hypothetical protein K7G98_36955, partial [Saccharothrix sp. MB29]|nr:hypothetical protein [Saccharothrix sp. MB29]
MFRRNAARDGHRAQNIHAATTGHHPCSPVAACTLHEITDRKHPDSTAAHVDHGQEEHPNGGRDSL